MRLLLARRKLDIGLICALRRRCGLALFGPFRPGSAFLIELRFAAETFGLRRRRRRLHLPHQPEIVVGVLQIVLAQHPVARSGRVARQLQVALVNERGRAAEFGVRSIGLERAIGRVVSAAAVIVMTAAARFTTAAPLTLH